MKIGILQLTSNSFPPFFYGWIESLSKKNEHSFVFIGGKKRNFINSSFVSLPFSFSRLWKRPTFFKEIFVEQRLDVCFVPENFNAEVDGCLLIFVTANGFLFNNTKNTKKIQDNKHIIISPFSFFNKDRGLNNVFTIYSDLPILEERTEFVEHHELLKKLEHKNYLVCYTKKPNFDDVIFLLKALSILKKKQKTQMQLVLVWKSIFPSIKDKLTNYKYKDDVILIEDKNAVDIFKRIIGNAYALVFPFLDDKEIIAEQLFSLRKHTPIIGVSNPLSMELMGNAGIWVSRENVGELADALKKIYLKESHKKMLEKEAEQRYKELLPSFNIEKLNNIIKEQSLVYKQYYFDITKQKNETSKTTSTH